ncbi:MAG: hypothetical protein OEQ13_00430 [Acidobacteriota bacterium]|nr:hypothetical protein [Acidobacteriota bacterium]
MNDDRRDERAANQANERDDHPIEELQSLLQPVSIGFFDRLHRRINRRLLAGQVMHLTWYAPFTVFLEFVSMLMGLIAGAAPDEQEARGRE